MPDTTRSAVRSATGCISAADIFSQPSNTATEASEYEALVGAAVGDVPARGDAAALCTIELKAIRSDCEWPSKRTPTGLPTAIRCGENEISKSSNEPGNSVNTALCNPNT